MRAFVQRNRLAVFFILAFILSWYPWLIALARGTTTGRIRSDRWSRR